jgi:sugar porter (SP) family MFS transporter
MASTTAPHHGDRETDAGEEHRRARTVRLITVVAALGGFLFGYDTGVISSALLYIAPDFHLSSAGKQVVVASLLLGAVIGAVSSGPLIDRGGRRRTLQIAAAVFALGAVASAFAPNVESLVAFRFVIGLALGASSTAVPAYLAEMSPPATRGRIVSMNQFLITVGILVSYGVDYAFSPAHLWRWMLGLAAVPAAAMFLGLLRLPETPRWLLAHDREDDAREVLGRTRAPDEIDDEVDEIHAAIEEESGSTYRQLFSKDLRPALRIGVGVPAINQLVGVNAVIYYAPTILKQTGFGSGASILSSVGIGTMNVLLTAVALLLIDRLGRRPLVITGTVVVTVALAALGVLYLLPSQRGVVAWLIVAALCIYIAAFAASLGVAIWLFTSEVYPTNVRGKGSSLGTFTHWGLDFVISLTVLSLISLLTTAGMFFLFCGLALLGTFYLIRYLPETRNRTLEQVQTDLT